VAACYRRSRDAHGATPRQVGARLPHAPSVAVRDPEGGEPGARAENAGAGDLVLSEHEVARLDAAFPLGRDSELTMLDVP
jgi:hypothetical protein